MNVSKVLVRMRGVGVVKVQEEKRTQQIISCAQEADDVRALSISLISEGF